MPEAAPGLHPGNDVLGLEGRGGGKSNCVISEVLEFAQSIAERHSG